MKKDGTSFQAKIVEVGQNEISYYEWNDASNTLYAVEKKDIASITYQNGEKEMFGTSSPDNNNSFYAPSAYSIEYEAHEDGGAVGMEYSFSGFLFGGAYGWLKDSEYMKSSSFWNIHTGYNFSFNIPQAPVFLDLRVLFGYYGMSYDIINGYSKYGNPTYKTKNDGDVFLGLNPRIGVELAKIYGASICIVAGYRWDCLKFKFDKENTDDFFTIGFSIRN